MRFLVQYRTMPFVVLSMERFSEEERFVAVSRLSDLEETKRDPNVEVLLFGAQTEELARWGYPEYFDCELAASEAPTA